MNQNNQQPAEPSRASRIEWSLRQIIEADDTQALTQEIIEAGRSALATHPAEPVEAAGAVPLDLSELDLWSPIAGSKMEVDNACGQYVRFADVQSLLATHSAEPVGGELVASDEPLWIQLGQGKIEVGQGHHGPNGERLPAILFGRNGAGAVGIETEGDRVMNPGECIAAITFENPESLDVVAEKLAELRARIWPGTAPAGALVASDDDSVMVPRRLLKGVRAALIDADYLTSAEWLDDYIAAGAPAAAPAELSVIREAVEAAFEERQGWRVKIAAAVRQFAAHQPIPTGEKA